MHKLILDTDTFSEVLKGVNKNIARKSNSYLTSIGYYTVTAVTVSEILYGFYLENMLVDAQNFLGYLNEVEILSFDGNCGSVAGELLSTLEKSGKNIGWADTLIASIALENQLPLVTSNTSHYQNIIDLGYNLIIENWKE